MGKIKIIKSGLFSSIQDGGRKGMAFYGIPNSGFMDRRSAHIANILAGNKKNNSLIEMTGVGGTIEFSESMSIAITGADMSASTQGRLLPMYCTNQIEKGSRIEFKNAINGYRTYLAIHGKWKLKKAYGSSSTYSYAKLGGMAGSTLQVGDQIEIDNSDKAISLIMWKTKELYSGSKIEILKGPEFGYLQNPKSIEGVARVTNQTDRMGSLLETADIEIRIPKDFESKPVFPGVIQCTASGKLLVVLQDGQTTGGYPRVGIIPKKELNKFNQLPIHKEFKFVLRKN